MKLIEIGKKYFESEAQNLPPLTHNNAANDLLFNVNEYPHAFVLGCLADYQIKAETAWQIPYVVFSELRAFSMTDLLKCSKDDFIRVFQEKRLHRFNKVVGGHYFDAIQKIHNKYDGDAANIWRDNPSSSLVVSRFLDFDGVGIKIATMAANILFRRFKIPFSDLCGIDISPDVHVRRVFRRMGLVSGALSCISGNYGYWLLESGKGLLSPVQPSSSRLCSLPFGKRMQKAATV